MSWGWAEWSMALPLLASISGFVAWVRTRKALPELPMPAQRASWPRVSMVIPACNEEANIEAALRAKLESSYPNLEVVVVEDRSSDGTGAIIDRLAANDPRVKVVHVTELPAGWLGKVHAMHVGTQVATGEYILYSDADVRIAPDTMTRSVEAMEREQLDFFPLFPELRPVNFWLDVALSVFLRIIIIGGRVWSVRNPKSRAAVGGGSFNFVRKSALDRSPGFEWMKMEVADDVCFAQMLKHSGARCAIFSGFGLVRLSFYDSLSEMVRGFEKNSYAAPGQFRLAQALFFILLVGYFELWPYVMLAVARGPAFWLALATAGMIALGQGSIARWSGRPLVAALVPCFGALVLCFTSLRGIIITHKNGGIRWRGTFYPLDELRRGVRLRVT